MMRRLILIFCLIPVFALSQKLDYKNFDKSVKYNNNGNIEKAIKYANKALENSPSWNQPNLLLASIYAKDRQIERAAFHLLEVYDENSPDDINGINQVVRLYYSHGFYQKALFYAEKIISNEAGKYRFANELDRYINNCKFAIEAIKNPVEFNPINLDNKVNSSFADFVNTLSVDGSKIFFTRRIEYNARKPQEDLFFFSFVDSGLNALPFNTEFNEGAITVSPDGSLCIYSACDRQNSIGGCDLFYRTFIEGLGWSEERNLGNSVNSKYWETQASFSPDGKYLYFISNREGGVGGDDIWRSEFTEHGFMQAENLGALINTRYNEMSPFLHPDNLTFYFSSNGHVGMGDYDIYVSRRGSVLKQWGLPENVGYPINTHNVENSLVVAHDGRTAYYTSNHSGFGQEDIFVFNLPESMQADKISELEIEIITQKPGDEVVLNNVTFASNSSEIDSTSYIELNKLLDYLIKHPHLDIEIQGHTDNIGGNIDNLILSEKRANSVYNYLLTKVKNKLEYRGYGESRPLSPNNTIEGRNLNRRTSFVITN
tara:strand:+ start:5793 stop:7421 length:1629 start_codon:yes stop_codon:yes gene_type:complete